LDMLRVREHIAENSRNIYSLVRKLHYEEKWSWKEIKEFLNERKDPRKWTPETKVKEKIYKSYLKEALPEKADT